MLEELNRAGAEIKKLAADLEAKVKGFFGGDHDAAADTTDHVAALNNAVSDHIAAVSELEKEHPTENASGNPPQPTGVADVGGKPMVDGATQSAASGQTAGTETPEPETVQPTEPTLDALSGLWVDAEGKALDPQPQIDPETGKPVVVQPAV